MRQAGGKPQCQETAAALPRGKTPTWGPQPGDADALKASNRPLLGLESQGGSKETRTRYHMLGHTGSLKGSACGSPRTCLFTRRFTSCCCSQSTCKHTERGFVSGGQTARQTELSSSWAPSPGTDPSHGAKRIAGERVPRPCRLSEAWKHARGSRWRQNACCSASSEKPGC